MGSRVAKKNKSKNSFSKKTKTKKMRKSSFSKVQKHFEVFNDSNENINRYADLPIEEDVNDRLDVSASHGSGSEDDIYDPSKLNFKMDDYEDSDEDKSEEENEKKEDANDNAKDTTTTKETGNAVEDNNDFIGFEDSSADEDADGDNDEEDEEDEDDESRSTQRRIVNMDYPWILNHDHSTQQEVIDWLCLEIRDFVAYVSPSREEIEIRNRTISNLRAAVKELWPDADLLTFGSYATDLYLPGSDIDCCINSKNGDKDSRQALYSLSTFLKRKKLAQQVEVIASARVPIIKFVDPESLIHIDVSFERTNGVDAAKTIRGWLEEQPGLRELVLIIKQFLHARRLNSVYNGGLGGFSTICLVYSFLRLHPKISTNEIDTLENLGVLLIDFFELYGKNFAYDDIGISLNDDDNKSAPFGYFRKKDYPELLRLERNSFTLCIQDPGDPSNNISRSSYNIRGIKKAFSGAFDLLTNRCYELYEASYKNRRGQSILGNVIKYKGKLREFKDERNLVENTAILENEKYMRKKRTIVEMEEDDEEEEEEDDDDYVIEKEHVFIDNSDEDEEEDIYHIEEPQHKKQKKSNPAVSKRNSEKMNDIMGIKDEEDEEEDEYLPYGAPTNDEFDSDVEETKQESKDKKEMENDSYEPTKEAPLVRNKKKNGSSKINKDAKREYWLNKGQSLSPQS